MPGVSTEQPQSEERRERPKVGVSNSEAPIFDRGVPKVMRRVAATPLQSSHELGGCESLGLASHAIGGDDRLMSS